MRVRTKRALRNNAFFFFFFPLLLFSLSNPHALLQGVVADKVGEDGWAPPGGATASNTFAKKLYASLAKHGKGARFAYVWRQVKCNLKLKPHPRIVSSSGSTSTMLPFFLRNITLVSIGVAPFRFPPTAGGLARGKSGPAGRERRGRHSPDLDVSSASARGRPAHATLHHHHDHHYHGEFQHGYGMSLEEYQKQYYRSSYQQQKEARAYTHSVNQTTFLVNEHKDNNSYDREHRVHTPWRYGTTLLTDTDGSGGRVSPLQSSLRPASPGVLPLLGEYESVDFVNDDIMVRYIDNTIPYN